MVNSHVDVINHIGPLSGFGHNFGRMPIQLAAESRPFPAYDVALRGDKDAGPWSVTNFIRSGRKLSEACRVFAL